MAWSQLYPVTTHVKIALKKTSLSANHVLIKLLFYQLKENVYLITHLKSVLSVISLQSLTMKEDYNARLVPNMDVLIAKMKQEIAYNVTSHKI